MADNTHPEEAAVLPVRDTVIFPGVVVPITVGREKSLKLVREAMESQALIALVTQRDMDEENPEPGQLHPMGTLAKIHHVLQLPNDTVKIMVQGLERVRPVEFLQTEPYMRARLEVVTEDPAGGREVQALMANANRLLQRYAELVQGFPEELLTIAVNMEDPVKLVYLIAFNLHFKLAERQELLEVDGAQAKLERLSSYLSRDIEIHELGQKIQSEVQTNVGKNQREFYLREQLKAITKELGDTDDKIAEAAELREKLAAANPPEEARKEGEREIARLEKLPPGSAEHTVIRTYLDWLVGLPWHAETDDQLDLAAARQILDADHYDLAKIKDRILEYLAVYKLKRDRLGDSTLRGPILCLVGPPGVGKTSLGQSIARALGRKFVRLSLGGLRDESEIRGHRRTYIGALPGRIIQAVSRCGSRNPVFLLDEIDKMGADHFRGDPASALLEVLDPEQNADFRDHYLDVPFDLSKVLFIATANTDNIPAALRDRMEVLHLAGYTAEEKVQIAHRHLVRKQVAENGLDPAELKFADDAVAAIVSEYTREAGVRQLEREIASICRKVAMEVAGRPEPVAPGEKPVRPVITVDGAAARKYLGKRRFHPELAEGPELPGVAVGLAWTETGGDILFIEASRTRGRGRLRLTGQLGDVMKESAQTAFTFVQSRARTLGIPEGWFAESDIHLHVPAGAIPKDGPSAGIAIGLAIASLASGRLLQDRLAMTGEITLRGRVLPVGGIKEKVLAARRAGITTVLLPHRNEPDLDEIPPELLREMHLVLVETMDEVLSHALCPGAPVLGSPILAPQPPLPGFNA